MKGIYLAAYKAYHPEYNIDYNDIEKTSKHINIIEDMLKIDLSNYDYIIATPPCNYWSKARGNKISDYSIKTKELLPKIIDKLISLNKPFIIENVRNKPRFNEYNLLNKNCFIYTIGRHTYWTNTLMNYNGIQIKDNIKNISKNKRQGSKNVHDVIEYWLKLILK